MKENVRELFSHLKAHYTVEEAKETIDKILLKYDPRCVIAFRRTDAEIIDSFKVDSMDDRHVICEIIARTGVTKRDYEDLSAEWEFHNAAWAAHVKRSSAKDVSLDYGADPRWVVRFATKVFDVLDIE